MKHGGRGSRSAPQCTTLYLLVSLVDGSLYTGQTNDLRSRLGRHNAGLIKSTKSKRPYKVGYVESYATRSEAMWREWELKKKWNTERKKKLIERFDQNSLRQEFGL
ncbi:MAG: GIY-YIG nuclease family protein [bacterium]